MKVYRIKPLEKKSIQWNVEMFRDNDDGSTSWFNMIETFRWGQGFVEEDMDCNLPFEGTDVAYARTDCGWGCEFDDSVYIEWEFSEDLSEKDQQAIKDSYYEGGSSWLFDGEHDWQVEDDYVTVYAPYQVDFCDEDGTVIEENIKLKPKPTMEEIKASMPTWPFNLPKDSEQGG